MAYYKEDYAQELEIMKADFFEMMKKSNQKITRQNLLVIVNAVNNMYNDKLMSKVRFLLFLEVVKQVWEETFKTEIGGFMYGDSETTINLDTWDERIN